MAEREKFGKLVLLEQTESTGLGSEYRAAKLGPAGLEKIVTILRLAPQISGNAEVARSLMDQAKVAAQLQNPNIMKIFGIGKVEQTYYISYEFAEGKSLRAVLDRCRQEAFPLQVEHALLIASKVCSALEYAQTRKTEAGRYFHGLVSPSSVVVSYEGEIRVKGFGCWPSRVREVLHQDDLRYLAPEQRIGVGEARSDIYGLGAVLFETLTGDVPKPDVDAAAQIAAARLTSPQGDDDSLPAPVAEILRKSLAADPAARYPDVQDMRKALDTLLFSGDFTPTTFNLAFFMHSLYREDIEREAKRLKEDREASYLEFLTDEPGRPGPSRPAAAAPPAAKTEPLDARAVAARISPTPEAAHADPPEPPPAAPHPHPPAAARDGAPGATSKEAAAGFTFHKEEKKARSGGLLIPAALVLLLGGGAAYYFLVLKGGPAQPAVPAPTAPPTLTPEAAAAQARIQELEGKLKAIEEEKAAAEAKAAEDAKKKVEAQAAARGQAADPDAVERAQEEARKKAKAEQEKRQQEETRRLEDQKRAEEQRVADEKRRADEQQAARAAEQARADQAAAAAAAVPATPPPSEAPSSSPVKPGTLVSLNDPGVVSPVVEKKPTLVYPPIALRQRVDGTVEVNALIDEKGNVVEVTVVTPAGGRAGLNEAAVDNVKRHKYRPATKDGVPVRVWIPLRVRFELPK